MIWKDVRDRLEVLKLQDVWLDKMDGVLRIHEFSVEMLEGLCTSGKRRTGTPTTMRVPGVL